MESIVKIIYHETADAKNGGDIQKYKFLRPIRLEVINIQKSLKKRDHVNIWLENKIICDYLDSIIDKKAKLITKLSRKYHLNKPKIEELCYEVSLLNFYIGRVLHKGFRKIGFNVVNEDNYWSREKKFEPEKTLN